jgi:hypothetical protein
VVGREDVGVGLFAVEAVAFLEVGQDLDPEFPDKLVLEEALNQLSVVVLEDRVVELDSG